ncbi:Hydrolase, carbon-nitrogen family protein [Taphrina deformans PYCC 5710]|uniref:Hydrolase, carbon-nitrogen family protein n=1 Tax=Taphrina deformans (strain PYCC 5710 / ATCC 11124 / CBS 356.35 / IMI 108563 / JCM 9778 / NBRC 8474) TaxID=1097556 RepID=R4XA20_TAPDE|nr:Hydrolase, carbon-nitrogen family protein [Taphrina deformans PYCC 5710]|eukprot:CCG81114.1 Hydrolase, carbon-nitrogen family protein [Taphrina deformans PYCC 5710]
MSQDSRYRNPRPELVDSFDDFLVNTALPYDDIQLPPELQPLNPEYEDEVPNQEAVNGIARATRPKEPAWRDLNLQDLVNRTDHGNTQAMDVGERLRQLNLENRSSGPPTNALRLMSMVKLNVAVAQSCAQQGDLDKTLAKLESLVQQAASQEAKFIVFPEAFVGGYPKFSTFGTEIGVRSAEGREEFFKYHQAAIVVPSSATDRISRVAKENDVSLVVGVIERDDLGATLYCTALYFDARAGYVAKHRKLMPTGAERLIWGFGDSTTIKAQNISITSTTGELSEAVCSATICWEN